MYRSPGNRDSVRTPLSSLEQQLQQALREAKATEPGRETLPSVRGPALTPRKAFPSLPPQRPSPFIRYGASHTSPLVHSQKTKWGRNAVAVVLSAFTIWFAVRKATFLFEEHKSIDATAKAESQASIQSDNNPAGPVESQPANVAPTQISLAISDSGENRVLATAAQTLPYSASEDRTNTLSSDIEEAIKRFEAQAEAEQRSRAETSSPAVVAALPKKDTQEPPHAPSARPSVQQTAPAAAPPMSANEAAAYLDRARKLMAQGDIAGARLFYEYLARRGNGAGALELAKSYDPAYLKTVFVKGLEPDLEQAKIWYRKAAELGERQAQEWLAKAETR